MCSMSTAHKLNMFMCFQKEESFLVMSDFVYKNLYIFQTPEMKKKPDLYGQLIIKEKADKQ